MVKPTLRTKTIGAKVTDEEYARLQELAGDVPLSEWMREVLLGQGEKGRPAAATAEAPPPPLPAALLAGPVPRSAADEAVLAEVLALRTILVNLFYGLARGERVTEERVRFTIEQADADKLARAKEALGKTWGR